jgi:hypothetical protein
MKTPRIQVPRSTLEGMALEFLRAYPKCREAESVTVQRLVADVENGANWTMLEFNSGRAIRSDCDEALKLIVPIMQHHFDLAPDA